MHHCHTFTQFKLNRSDVWCTSLVPLNTSAIDCIFIEVVYFACKVYQLFSYITIILSLGTILV